MWREGGDRIRQMVAGGEEAQTTVVLRRLEELGRDDAWRRLAGSLEIDIDKARDRLGWTPPYGVERDIQAMATAFLAQND